ncbi:hypothetical protein QL996_04615 [Planococcus sp. APC 4015]|nr:hypothetical protein [Planococcus sp. APC 4015]
MTTATYFRRRNPLWAIILSIIVIAAIAAMAGVAVGRLLAPQQTVVSSEVVEFVLPQQKVTLASLRVEGLERANRDGRILGVPLDVADRTKYLIYKFDANVGLDGSQVQVDRTGAHSYSVSIPAFDLLSHSNIHFEDPINDDGILAFLTDEISQSEMTNRILSDEKKADYVANSIETVRAQAEAFYGGIITSVDADATITFEFAQ